MRPLIYYAATSLDGFIAGPNDEIDWLFTDGDYGFREFFDSLDTIITGRKTWDISKTFEEIPFKDKDIVVFSRSGCEIHSRSKENSLDKLGQINDPVDLTKRLLAMKGSNIWLLGGGDIAGQLANAGLISDLVVSIHPIFIGSGIPLFAGLDKRLRLELLKCEPFPSGLLQITYKVVNDA